MSGNLDSFLLGSDFSMIEVHFFIVEALESFQKGCFYLLLS